MYVCVVFSSMFVCASACVCVHAVMMFDFILVLNPGITSERKAYCQTTNIHSYMHIIIISSYLIV